MAALKVVRANTGSFGGVQPAACGSAHLIGQTPVFMIRRLLVPLWVAFLLTTLSCQFIQSVIPSGGNSAAPGGALLNEVLFLPAQGEAGFVEIKSPGTRVSLQGLYLMNERGESYPLPDGVSALASDQFLLIIFDGTNSVEDKTVHAGQAGFLSPESGFVELYASDRTLLDRVAWGPAQPDGVRLSRGGMDSALAPGTTIGRFPLSTAVSDRLEWVPFAPAQATPGAPNPQPGAEILLPLSGAVFDQPQVSLNWYPVAGAVKYRVQLAADRSFAALALDQTVDLPPLTTGPLQPGQYFWRVQAFATDGSSAVFSAVNSLSVRTGSPSLAAPDRGKLLSVPLYAQHKDTAMLLLESSMDRGDHAWDAPHAGYSAGDPADQSNCGPAAIAMINAKFGGHLSQDRIGYEIFKDRLPGPERDLNYADGFNDDETDRALSFALGVGVLPTWRPAPKNADALWTDVKDSIDAGRPVLAKPPGHAVVITGYWEADGQRLLAVNDPLIPVPYLVNVEPGQASSGTAWEGYVLLGGAANPASDEPAITQDSDGDGVVDFDETQRFHTDPNNKDTDQDKVNDKQEIYASVFDEQYGYGRHYSTGGGRGRDFDGDGKPMELDPDSDNGGCFDGIEDLNHNGKYDQSANETYNFDKKDDKCFSGTYEYFSDTTWHGSDDPGFVIHTVEREFVTFAFYETSEGKMEGQAHATYTFSGGEIAGRCTGIIKWYLDPETVAWDAQLSGTVRHFQNGNTDINMQATPDHGPSYTKIYTHANMGLAPECSFGHTYQADGMLWDGFAFMLKPGQDHYDLRSDLGLGANETGQKYIEIHIKSTAK